MATTYPLATLAPTITGLGISTPLYADILASLKASAQQIFGADVYLEADSQDGQLLALVALSVYDCNQAAVATYNSFSPATAVGNGLSSVVKINHLARLVATRSQVNLAIGGTVGTVITNGVAGDAAGNRWNLPASVTIPPSGTITVTATCSVYGAISAPIASVTLILTPTAGWQTVTNAAAAVPGQPVETDAELRTRQEISPSINANTPLTSLAAAIGQLPGVVYGAIYENDTSAADANGVPAHSIAVVVQGGVANDIAHTIYEKKAPGVGTHGSTTIAVPDVLGVPHDVKFSVPTLKAIKVEVTLTALAGYTTTIGGLIADAITAYVTALPIGADVIISRLYAPALLNDGPLSETYEISVVKAALVAGALGTTNIPIAYTEKATLTVVNVTFVLL